MTEDCAYRPRFCCARRVVNNIFLLLKGDGPAPAIRFIRQPMNVERPAI